MIGIAFSSQSQQRLPLSLPPTRAEDPESYAFFARQQEMAADANELVEQGLGEPVVEPLCSTCIVITVAGTLALAARCTMCNVQYAI